MPELYSYQKVSFDIKILSLYVTPLCFLRKWAHAIWRMYMRFWYFVTYFLKESTTTTQARSILVQRRTQWKLLIHLYRWNIGYTYYQIKEMKIELKDTMKLYSNIMNVQVYCLSKALNILFSIQFVHLIILFLFIASISLELML